MRDFLADDVSELSSVAAVDVDEDVVTGAGGAFVLVVVVVVAVVASIGCRQQVEEDRDIVSVDDATFVVDEGAADDDDMVFVDSFVLLPWAAVFNIFSSQSPGANPCRTEARAQRGHSPALNGCSSVLLQLASVVVALLWFNFKSLNLSLISHTELAVTIKLGLTGLDAGPAASSCCCCRNCC